MTISPEDRVLRLITIWTWFPAFGFLLGYGIASQAVVPTLGIVPMTFSALFGLVSVAGLIKGRVSKIAIDTFTAAFLVAIFIPGMVWVREGRGRYWYRRWASPEMSVVGTFGCSTILLNFCIHTWFVLHETSLLSIFRNFFSNLFSSPTCPHCQRSIRIFSNDSAVQSAHSSHSSSSKESYAPVTMIEPDDEPEGRPSSSKDPRPSTDDETARLV